MTCTKTIYPPGINPPDTGSNILTYIGLGLAAVGLYFATKNIGDKK